MGPVFGPVAGTPATPQFWEVILEGQYAPPSPEPSSQVLHVLHFVRQTGPGTTLPAQLAEAVQTAVQTALEAAMTEAVEYGGVKCRSMDDPTTPYVYSGLGPITGSRAVESLPSYATVTMRKKTAARGRNYRGSIHFAGVAEEDTEANILDAGGITLWQAVATALATMCTAPFGVGDDTFQMVVLSPTLSTWQTSPTTFYGALANDISLNNLLGTMRRRKQGVGA